MKAAQIILIGLGPGDADAMSRGAERALRAASADMSAGTGALFLRTAKHPCVETLREWGLKFTTFDALYESAPDFASVYKEITDRIISCALSGEAIGAQRPFTVAYAVPGHPLVGEETVRLILAEAKAQDIAVHVVSSASFVEAVLTAAGVAITDGCDVRDALTLPLADTVDPGGNAAAERIDVTRNLLLFQVYDTAAASHAKLALMRFYPDDWEIQLIRWAGVAEREEVRPIPLYRLDHEPVDYLTTVYVPPLPPPLRPKSFASLVGIMARLRAPDGCPWDREQSHASLKRYFVEETYEVLEAIDAEDPQLLCEELGDALLQVVFHAQLAAEEGVFTIDDVTAAIVAKLVRRHPHVFGTTAVSGSDEVLRNWERIKREEKTGQDPDWRKSILDGVPKGLPALMQALEISKRVVKVGFEWNSLADVIAKLDEELTELKAELAAADPDTGRVRAELGDLLFTVVQIARWQQFDPEEALRDMLARFTARFRYIEQRAHEQGRELTDMSLAEMDSLWEEAKRG